MSSLRLAVRHIIVAGFFALAVKGYCQPVGWTQADIGTPAVSSAWGVGGGITTSTKGLAAVGGADEYAFSYQTLLRSDSVEHVIPALASGSVGRAQGLAIRQSTDPASPAVFWGLRADGSGTPKLAIQWRRALGGGVLTSDVNDAPLRSSGGELKLRLQWYGTQAVASYYHHATSTWKPLYAVEMTSATGAILGGVVHASGTAALSWTDSVPTVESVSKSRRLVPWAKVSEPALAAVPLRETHIGYGMVQTAPMAPNDWTATADPGLTNGDNYHHLLDSSSPTSVKIYDLHGRVESPLDLFIRWGAVSGSTPTSNASVEVTEEVYDEMTLSWVEVPVFSRSIDQARDSGFWVYVGTLPAQLHDTQVNLSAPASSSGHLSIDGLLLLSLEDAEDQDRDGLPDAWEQLSGPRLGMNPEDDADGDGVSNAMEFAQNTDPRTFNFWFYNDLPVLTRVGPEERKAPLGSVLVHPLQVQICYADGVTPVPGCEVTFSLLSSFSTLASTADGQFFSNGLMAKAGPDGIASAYVKLGMDEGSLDVMLIAELLWNSASFELQPYENHEPGPIDFSPKTAVLSPTDTLADSGKVALRGSWLAVAHPGIPGTSTGSVQLYRWHVVPGQWRAAYSLVSPSSTPLADGFGAEVQFGDGVLAIRSSGTSKLHLYHLHPHSEYWERTAEVSIPAGTTGFAVTPEALAVADPGQDQVLIYKKGTSGWQVTTPTTLAPGTSRALEVSFGAALRFSEDGASLWVGAPAEDSASPGVLGEMRVYHRASGGSWNLAATVTAPAESQNRWFGISGAWGDELLYVGAPASPAVASPTDVGHVYVYRYVSSAWQKDETVYGNAADFGAGVWRLGNHLAVGYHDDVQTPVVGTSLNRVSLFLNLDTSHTHAHDTVLAAQSASSDSDSLVLSSTTPDNIVVDHRLTANISYSSTGGDLVGHFDFNDIDADLDFVQLLQTGDYWSLDTTGAPQLKVATGADLTPAAGTLQSFNLRLGDLAGSTYEESFLVKVAGEVPSVPSSLAATVVERSAVHLDWVHDGSGRPTFNIERAPLAKNTAPSGGETFQSIALANEGTRHFWDRTVTSLQDYVYRVRAQGDEGASDYSNLASLHWDADNDDIPDWWEAAHGGALDPSLDPDGDGLNNLQEYLNGTNPNLVDTDGDGLADGADSAPLNVLNSTTGFQVFTPWSKN